MSRWIFCLVILSVLLTGCNDDVNSYESCKRHCIDIQCAEIGENCGWHNYDSWVYPEGNKNSVHDVTYSEVVEINRYCLNQCRSKVDNNER